MLKSYLLAARPKTLPAAIVPVWVGCALAWKLQGSVDWWLAACTLLGAVFIQIATNLFNDAVDAEKGADTEARLGPRRATASGLLSRRAVYAGAFVFVLLATLASLPLIAARGWVILAIGVPSLLLSYGYTGGPFPLAYRGMGEVFVILFFGLVAVGGTVFVQSGSWSAESLVVGAQVGLLSAVLIAINNIRDVAEDRVSGKRTLAVRFGPVVAKGLVGAMVGGALGLSLLAGQLLILTPIWFVVGLGICVGLWRSEPGKIYNRYLALAALQLILFAVVFTAGAVR